MRSSSTFVAASNRSVSNCREKFKYFFSRNGLYQLKHKFADLDNKYRLSERKAWWIAELVDFSLTGSAIGLVLVVWFSDNWFFRGFSIALGIVLFKTYVREFRDLFRKRTR
jgi:hypothetical protein